ncbi:MAG: LPS export ABC transporter periplasmic protein LptC [Candidatus Omnitrophota bacterium]
MNKKIFLFLVFFLISGWVVAEEPSNQQFLDFNLSGYGQGGKKTWEVRGQSADIFENIVKLTNIVANVYGQDEDMTLTAKTGSMNKETGNMHLEQDVVATTKSGAKLTTDSLDWQRSKDLITTPDKVVVEKENMTAVGFGAEAKPSMSQAEFKKDITVNINTAEKDKPANFTIITCDGPMEIDYQKQQAVFNKNCKAVDAQGTITAERMEVYFDLNTKQLIKIICKGNVKIQKGENTSFSDEAIYLAAEKKMTLLGRPKLILLTEGEEESGSLGDNDKSQIPISKSQTNPDSQ